MAKRTTVEKWKTRIERAIVYKENYGGASRWLVFKNYYRGKFPSYNASIRGVLPYNLVFAMARVIVPSVYYKNPYIMASPRAGATTPGHAQLIEGIINWLMQELEVKKAARAAILDAYFTGRGIFKLGYDSEFGYSERGPVEEVLGTEPEVVERTEFNNAIKPGMPWVVRVDPEMFLVPYGTWELGDCPWVDHIAIRELDDAKADGRYSNLGKVEGTHVEKVTGEKKQLYDEMSQDTDLLELHEIRDIRKRQMLTVTWAVGDKTVYGPEDDPLQIDGLPFVDFCFNDDPDYYWCSSDVQIMEPQQLELNEARTQAVLHRRLALIKMLARRGAIKPEEIKKFMSDDVMPLVWTEGDPKEAVAFLAPWIPPDLLSWVREIRQDAREIVGLARQELGADTSTQDRMSATKSLIIHAGSQLRLGDKRNAVGDALIKVARKLLQITFKFWDPKKVMQVVGVDGAKYWVTYDTAAIQREYDFTVDVESMAPATTALRRQELIQIIQVVAQNPNVDINYLLRALLRQYSWIDALKVLPEAPETQGGKAMPSEQFVNMQNKMLADPETRQRRLAATTQRIAAG